MTYASRRVNSANQHRAIEEVHARDSVRRISRGRLLLNNAPRIPTLSFPSRFSSRAGRKHHREGSH